MILGVIQASLWTGVIAGLLWASATDLKMRIIPDEVVLLIALSGVALCLAAHPAQVWLSLLAAAAVFLGAAFLCRSGMIGGGDVKLLAAVTLLFPPHETGTLLLEIALAGGVLSCAYLGASFMLKAVPLRRAPLDSQDGAALSRWFRLESERIASRKEVPYGIAILGGVIWHIAGGSPKCFFAMSCSL
jgi:prepilin peptidase CpaA